MKLGDEIRLRRIHDGFEVFLFSRELGCDTVGKRLHFKEDVTDEEMLAMFIEMLREGVLAK